MPIRLDVEYLVGSFRRAIRHRATIAKAINKIKNSEIEFTHDFFFYDITRDRTFKIKSELFSVDRIEFQAIKFPDEILLRVLT